MMNWKPYLCRIVCSAIGLLAAISFLTLGFWKTSVILVCCGIGYLAGTYKDTGSLQIPQQILTWLDRR